MKLNKIALGLIMASCATATAFSANAELHSPEQYEKRLSMDDDLNIIRGLDYKHMLSTDGGKTWQRYIDQESWQTHREPEKKFLGQVTVQVAELDTKVVNSVTYDENATYDKPGTVVMHDGYFWTNGWWTNPGEKPGENPVWTRGEAVKVITLATFQFTPFKGQQAIDYQKKLKQAVAAQRKVIGYFPEWGVYDAHNNFTPEKVAYNQISHLNYGFAIVTEEGVVKTHDTWKGPEVMTDIAKRTKQAGVVNMISIGGYTNSQLCVMNCDQNGNGVKAFQAATATPEKVERLANSIVEHMVKWQFDGVDIDWEYPESEQEAQQFTQLIKSLRAKLDELGKQNDRYYQLSSAVTANHNNIKYLNPAETTPLLDSVNVMTYDYHGAFDPITGHNSPLFSHYHDSDLKFNIDATMREYNLQWNIPKSKLLVGLAWYGRAWGDVEASEKISGMPGLFNSGSAKVQGQWDDKDEYTGTNPYRKLKQMALDKQFQRYWDAQSHVPYLYNASTQEFYSYDDAESIKEKVDYIKNEGYGGAIIWDLSGDTDDHELGAISATLLSQDQALNLKFAIARQPDDRVAIQTTLDKETFNSEKRIMIYINGVYQGEIYNGKSYYSYNTFNADDTVTVKTNFTQEPNVGDTVKVILAEGKPGGAHAVDKGDELYSLTITADMIKPLITKEMAATLKEKLKYTIARQSDNKIAIKTTLDKETFDSENRIMVYINGVYEGEIYNGKSYYSYNTYNADNTITVKTNFTTQPKVGDEVKVILSAGKPGWRHSVDRGEVLYRTTITQDMLK